MKPNIILASESITRQNLLTQAGVIFNSVSAKIDEITIKKFRSQWKDFTLFLKKENFVKKNRRYS